MIEAATPMKPKKGAEVGQSSEIAKSKTVESIIVYSMKNYERMKKGKRRNAHV